MASSQQKASKKSSYASEIKNHADQLTANHCKRDDYHGLDPAVIVEGKACAASGRPAPSIDDNPKSTPVGPDEDTWKTAEDLSYFPSNGTNPHSEYDKHNVRIQMIIYVIMHHLSQAAFTSYVNSSANEQGSETWQAQHRAQRNATNWQRAAFKYFEAIIRQIRSRVNIPREFDLASYTLRSKLFNSVFDRDPYLVTKKMLGATSAIVDLDNIFHIRGDGSRYDDRRTRWQKPFRAMFRLGCQDMVRSMFYPEENGTEPVFDSKQWYQLWRINVQRREWHEAFGDLWTIKNLPCVEQRVKGGSEIEADAVERK